MRTSVPAMFWLRTERTVPASVAAVLKQGMTTDTRVWEFMRVAPNRGRAHRQRGSDEDPPVVDEPFQQQQGQRRQCHPLPRLAGRQRRRLRLQLVGANLDLLRRSWLQV